jgi:phosphoribosyl-ATP pyrophosphohydrolase/phosphoribosyl-AMP cyclohydrolase/histidinol dehydrogenase
LEQTTWGRKEDAPEGSYTRRLFEESGLLGAKLIEEAGELSEAVTQEDVAHEAADVMYFALVAMAKAGVTLADVEAVLDERALKVKRRKGDAKVALA